ncbi:OmpA family protein, partial [Myxococcota bacterium]
APMASTDADGDGIDDARDQCPNQPEDRDGFEDADGCPDPDNDQDRIPDVSDKCPNHPETYNGYEDGDGCPDRPLVKITTSSPGVLQWIQFRPRSIRIPKRSESFLREVAKVMKQHQRITLVEVQGHANDYRTAKADQRLSLRRARAVRDHLIRLDVAPARLVAKGYGRTRPMTKGRTASERARNRRVMFRILKQTLPRRTNRPPGP